MSILLYHNTMFVLYSVNCLRIVYIVLHVTFLCEGATTTSSYVTTEESQVTTEEGTQAPTVPSTTPFCRCQNGGFCNDSSLTSCNCTGTGFEGEDCSDDIDECSDGTHTCHPGQVCNNDYGNYSCGACTSGWAGSNDTCIDVDECSENTHNCVASTATCNNTQGSFECACNSGYAGDGTSSGTGCSDVDECGDGADSCNTARSSCVNIVGTYNCTCDAGYEDAGDGKICNDIDECTIGTHDCLDLTADCTNEDASFSCACKTGYSGDGVYNCTDIDECTNGTDDCHPFLAACANTIGGFTCTCTGGLWGDGRTCAETFDECAAGIDKCKENTTCLDIAEGWNCICASGYEGDGNTQCLDVNECALGLHNCHPVYANCINIAPNYDCECKTGYAGNGQNCVEINECAGQLCSGKGSCTDLLADFDCNCDYSYWGKECQHDSLYPTTTNFIDGALYWSFDILNTTGDDKYANQNINYTAFNADPGVTTPNDYAISGNSIRTSATGVQDCLNFGDFSGLCVSDPDQCGGGLSVSLWMRLTQTEIKQGGTNYIMSTGPPDSRGFAMYRSSKKIGVIIGNGPREWRVEVQDMIPADIWKNVGFSWDATHGLKLLIDAEVVGTDLTGSGSFLAPIVGLLTLGCRHNGGSFTGPTSGVFDELAIWPSWFNSTYEYNWMMGGWDHDNCITEPCVHGDCFDVGVDAYRCDCHPGYNATHCDIEIDECASNPCQNGGVCTDHIAIYTCECPFGYSGHSCEIDLTPNFDVSLVVPVSPATLIGNPSKHPYYNLATIYWPLSDLPSMDPQGSNFTTVPGRGNTGLYPQFGADDSWISMGDFAGHCLASPIRCTTGFTLAMWVNFMEEIQDTTDANMPGIILYSGHFLSGGGVGIKLEFLKAGELRFRVVNGYTNYTEITLPAEYISYTFTDENGTVIAWNHFAFLFTPDGNLTAYVNGIKAVNAIIGIGDMDDSNFDNTLTLGTRYSALKSAYPYAISDIVYWDRPLRDFEVYLLFGLTRREYELSKEADYYWTTDGFARREQGLIQDQYNLPNNFLPMTGAAGVTPQMAPGMDTKGYAAYVLGDKADLWLVLGDFTGHCIGEPKKCTDGISISIWVQLPQNMDNGTHFILSSGEQVHRGFSIYQRDVDKLGAAVTDGRKRWVAEVTFLPFIRLQDVNLNTSDTKSESYLDQDELTPWMNLALTWSEHDGIKFYIDGRIRALDPDGYRKFRNKNSENLLVVGRRNDYLGDAVNMTFEELVIMERLMKPYEVRESLAKLDNLEYMDAKYFWDAQSLFSNKFDILNTKTNNDTDDFIGPSSGVQLLKDNSAVRFTADSAFISLGNFRKDFVSDPSVNPKGMSIAFWAKLTFTVDGAAKFILSSGAQVPAGCRGIALYALDDKLYLKINDGSYTWEAAYNTTDITEGEWTNIAFTWHKTKPLKFYVNGMHQSPVASSVTEDITQDTYTMFVIGRRNNANNGYYEFDMRSLVIWDRYFYSKFVHKMLGISSTEKYYFDLSDYYWTFDPDNTLIRSLRSMTGGSMYVEDRNLHGRAIFTDGVDGLVSLERFGDHCITNPFVCKSGFVLAMWIKIKDLYRGELCLASTGAEVDGERGISIQQTPDYLVVTVNDGVTTWTASVSEDNYDYDYWQYLSVRWRGDDGLAVGINGTELNMQASGTNDRRNNIQYKELVIGGCSNGRDGFMESTVDDIILITPDTAGALPTIDQLSGEPVASGYLSADEFFNITSPDSGVTSVNALVTSMGGFKSNSRGLNVAATGEFGYVDMGNFDGRCLSSPYLCTEGITLSLWLRLLDDDVDNINDTESNPEVGYILSSGAQHNESAGFAISTDGMVTTFEVHDGLSLYMSQYNFTYEGWMNIAMTWNWLDGIEAYINGVEQIPYIAIVEELPTTESMYTTLNATNATGTEPATTEIPYTTADYNMTDCNNTANENHTDCIFINSTTPAPPPPTEPVRLECNTTRCDDEFTRLILGKRNDRDDGYLRAEFADFAVWYSMLDTTDPEFGRKLIGQEFPGVELTTDHSALDSVSVWTGTIECGDRHAVDCTQNLDEFFEVAETETVIDEALKDEIVMRLKNYSNVNAYITAVEMDKMTKLVDKVVARELPEVVNVTEAETELSDLLEITSNLFATDRKRRWVSIQQNEGGATKMMNELDGYAMNMANRMQTDNNGTKGDLDTTVTTDNIVLSVSRIPINYDDLADSKEITFPNYKDERLKSAINETWDQPQDSITLPSNFFDFTTKDAESATVIGFMYNTVSDFLPLESGNKKIKDRREIKLTSRVLSLEVEPKLRMELHNPIVIVLAHKKPKSDGEEAVCSFWDYNVKGTINGAWNTEGCDVHTSNVTHTVCHCYHLTHFGIIVQPMDEEEPDPNDVFIQYITFGGTGLSLIALITLLGVYCCVKSLHTTRNMIHTNLCLAMLLAKIAYVMVFMAKLHPIACKSVAVCMQYFYTATFAWMLVEGIYLLIEIESEIGTYFRRHRSYLYIIGWGVPMMIMGCSVALHFDSYGTENSCWVTFEDGTVYMFVGPAFCIVVINCLILFFVMRHIDDVASRDKDHFESRRASVRATAILLPLLGLSWVCATLNSMFTTIIYLRYAFAILNSLQGVFIFLFHGLGSKEIRMVMKKEDLEVEFTKVEKMMIRKERIAQGKEPAMPAMPAYHA